MVWNRKRISIYKIDRMTKEVKVTGRIPNSVRSQVGNARKSRTRKTLKNKRIKKIKTPVRTSQPGIKRDVPVQNNTMVAPSTSRKGGILQVRGKRVKNKTAKKVRFNLESEGVQTGKFRNALRVKMKTAKAKSRHNRSKNRTLKNRRFKIRFSNEKETKEDTLKTGSGSNTGLDLVSRLKEFNKEASSDMMIARVQAIAGP